MSNTRRQFLKAASCGAVGASLASFGLPAAAASAIRPRAARPGDPRPTGVRPVHDLTTSPLAKVRVAHIGLGRGLTHAVDTARMAEFVEVVALCDIREDRTIAAAAQCEKLTGKRPELYFGNDTVWEKMVERDDIDVVYVSTPWAAHVPMSVRAMERGKHAFVEVNAAETVADCWKLVDVSERTRRHCVLLENCCYGEKELFVLNLTRQGMFGELNHAECAYLHELRAGLFKIPGGGDWRRNYHLKVNGNLYPTHGLGPVAQYFGLGRGDQFKHLVSMSSPEASLTRYRDKHQPNNGRHAGERYVCGDMNTSLIKTELGRTIMIQHNVVSPRPYSRINSLYGTLATFADYPARLAFEDPKAHGLKTRGHSWLSDVDLKEMMTRHMHPIWQSLRERSAGGGHGGMDFVMNFRHLDSIRRGVTPDSVVYDAAAWSSINELSARSNASGSVPVEIPDFTRGLWRQMKPLAAAI